MKKSRFSEAQIVGILKEGEAGVGVAQILRKHGISHATFYKWKSKYSAAPRSMQPLRNRTAATQRVIDAAVLVRPPRSVQLRA